MQLTELDRHRLGAFVVGFGGFCILLLLFSLLPQSGPFVGIGIVASIGWVGASWVMLNRWYSFRCPSCGTAFFQMIPVKWKFLFRNPYSNKCVACGCVLPKA